MSMIFRFTMLCDENDDFVRDYEVDYAMQLIDLHQFLCADLGYDSGQMASFFTSNREWEKLHEYTLMDMGANEDGDEYVSSPMDQVSIGQIIHKNHDRLIYVFDYFGDRALFLELMETHPKNPDAQYPRCVVSQGAAPDQFNPGAGGGDGSIFDEVMEDFNDFDGDENYDDDY